MNPLIEKRKILKAKFQKREKVFGVWTSLSHPSISEIFTRADVDFLGIDLEHSTISQEQSQRIIAAAQANQVLCLPRLSSHNSEMCRRLCDSGADGVIVPMVSQKSHVDQIISWCKYPPVGRRGYGISRAQGYGFDFAEYATSWNEASCVIAQIESIEAVKNAQEIVANPHLDGVMIGPYDISGSLDIPGQLDDPRVLEASRHVIDVCRRLGKSCGTHLIHPEAGDVRRAFDLGYTFVILSSDIFVLWKWTERANEWIRAAKKA